jgi:hypothetical protein
MKLAAGHIPGELEAGGEIIKVVRPSRGVYLLGVTASLDARANRHEKCTCRTDYSEDCRWIFRGINTSVLSIQREGDGREEGDTSKY